MSNEDSGHDICFNEWQRAKAEPSNKEVYSSVADIRLHKIASQLRALPGPSTWQTVREILRKKLEQNRG